MFEGCTTALIAPMNADGAIDWDGFEKLVEFQLKNGISGLLVSGTTGESPTLTESEKRRLIERLIETAGSRCFLIAGTGSNSTAKTISETEHARTAGVNGVLLVDPYYNGPSSIEMMKEYYSPVAAKFPDLDIIPYIIPGRTGTQLHPQELASLHRKHANIKCVKEATGSLENMRLTRELCGNSFTILSGDDDKTFEMMTDPRISAAGVISVASNIVPGPLTCAVELIRGGKSEKAAGIMNALKPLFSILTVKTTEETPFGNTQCRARNPLPVKTLMRVMGIPAGPCRAPLGRMTKQGIALVLDAARRINEQNPEFFEPVERHFDVNIEERLSSPKYTEGLFYEQY